MTAFADHESRVGGYAIRWEIRSVNSRYLDLILRLPDNMRFLEPDCRDLVSGHLKRGKVECSLRMEPLVDASCEFELNRPLVRAVLSALQEIEPMLTQAAPVSPLELASWPGVLKEPEADRTHLGRSAIESLEETCHRLVTVRRREGGKLAQFIHQRCQPLREQVAQARRFLPETLDALRDKLRAKILEVSAEPNLDRLEQELVYLAQKLDVSEELDRLETHLDEVDRLLASDQPVGRRLDFLCQEMNREANTLAAKAASTPMTQVAIEMKVLIEQMREQVQNIE